MVSERRSLPELDHDACSPGGGEKRSRGSRRGWQDQKGCCMRPGGSSSSGDNDVDGLLRRGPQFERIIELDAWRGLFEPAESPISDLAVDRRRATWSGPVRMLAQRRPRRLSRNRGRRRAGGSPSGAGATSARSRIVDAVIGALGAAVPASFSDTLQSGRRRPRSLLGLVGAVVWPVTIGLTRGYQRRGVGVGSEELRAVLRAAVAVVVAGAFPAGLLQQHALLKLVVVATPAGAWPRA